MKTRNIEFIRHRFELVSDTDLKNLYQLVSISPSNRVKLPKYVQIEPFSGTSIDVKVTLSINGTSSLKTPLKLICGVKPTSNSEVYFGDVFTKRSNLIIVEFSPDGLELVIDYFNSFYPYQKGWIWNLISEHQLYFDHN
ncbi:MAG: hypothetical protein RLN79_05005 [Cytophagales bacterium]